MNEGAKGTHFMYEKVMRMWSLYMRIQCHELLSDAMKESNLRRNE